MILYLSIILFLSTTIYVFLTNYNLIYNFVYEKIYDFLKICIDIYLYINKKSDNIYKTNTYRIKDNYFTEYNVVKDDKNHIMILKHEEIYKDVNIKINNKNLIVYSGLVDNKKDDKNDDKNDDKSDDDIDITEIFRKFFYYYDTDKSINYFLDYINEHLNLNGYNDYHLVIYLNNDELTERKYLISELKNKTFNDLIK